MSVVPTRIKSIAVIGAGVIGASLAYHLTKRGMRVHLFDCASGPACGITGRGFGWINLINGTLTHPASFRLRQAAVEDYKRLQAELPVALLSARKGSLVWSAQEDATKSLVSDYRAAGVNLDVVDNETAMKMEPFLRDPPSLAAYLPDDLAIDPVDLTENLVSAAIEAGAEAHFGREVLAIETASDRVTGVRTAEGFVGADIVISAAGPALDHLTSELGINTGITTSPALLVRFAAPKRFVFHIVRTPDLEIRQADDNTILVAAGFAAGPNGDEAMSIAQATSERIKAHFTEVDLLEIRSATIGARPMFEDGLPRLGFLAGIGGLYVAAGHPGLILAPIMGRLAAAEIVDGARSPLIPSH